MRARAPTHSEEPRPTNGLHWRLTLAMHPNAALLERLYACFARRDHAGMAACYHADASFRDPAFGELRGAEVPAMWRMLCERGADLRVEASNIGADDQRGRAHWEAWYTFSRTGRPVHNVVEASFELEDGKIRRHVDDFSRWAWARQAIGPAGLLLGWSGFFGRKLQAQARGQLESFMRKGA